MKTFEITIDTLRSLVAQAIANFQEMRPTRELKSQIAVEDAIQACYDDGDIMLAATLLHISAA